MRNPAHAHAPVIVAVALRIAAQTHLDRPLGPRNLPRIAEAQPLVRLLHLPAIHDLLLEDPELVANAVADARNLQRRQGVEETGGESSEAAVAETRFLLAGEDRVEVQPELGHRIAHLGVASEVDEVVAE